MRREVSDKERMLKKDFYAMWTRAGGLMTEKTRLKHLVDPRWRHFQTFARDVGEPNPGHYIRQDDPKKMLGPNNWRWANSIEDLRLRNLQKGKRRTDRLTWARAYDICVEIFKGATNKEIALKFDADPKLVSDIRTGRSWRDAYAKAYDKIGKYLD